MPASLTTLLLTLLLTFPAIAGEYAVLSNGFRLHVDSHRTAGGLVQLQINQGAMELPADQVVRFEEEDYVAAPPPAPAAASPQPAPAPSDPKQMVAQAAQRAGLPAAFVQSVAAVESGYHANAVSPKGAIGIMQLMPGTAADHAADPNDPRQNVDAGAMHLRELLLKYHGDMVKALAAYNAGPGAVDRYNGLPPYPETQAYVQRVLSLYEKAQR
ncbi:MAG: lytic transglycosylase domain-containing protein [Bryobacteraceae bacterium]